MASAVPVLLLLSTALFTTTVADKDCESYISSNGLYKPSIDCNFLQFCCGDCNNRFCCSNPLQIFTEDAQNDCIFTNDFTPIAIGVSVAAIVIFIIFFIVCCVCPCCCLYKMCRKPAPIVTTTTHTVISAQYPQQPVVPAGQYPPYQPVGPPAGYRGQPGYGGPPMPTGPYQGQPYIAGPPPPYQEAGGPGYPAPYSQAAFDGGQASYPVQPPVHPGLAHPGLAQPVPQTGYNSTQPAYNPAYMEQPKTGF